MRPFVLEESTIAGIHAAMEAGELTCQQLVADCLDRIARYDRQGPCLNAVIAVSGTAVDTARQLDEQLRETGRLSGPLHGIPVLLKDNCETADLPTTAGSLSLAGWETGRDAFLVKRLKEAGAVVLAKTNLHEFAVWGETVSSILGQTRNPYDLTRTPGGSSGGTGAALAAGYGVIGIGTDTVNSIRSPSSACSLCGIRPTIGLVSRAGVVPYSMTQDTAGPMARTVEDAVRTLDAIAAFDPDDPVTASCRTRRPESYTCHLKADGLRGKRIGVLESFFGREDCHRAVNEALAPAMHTLKQCGAELVSISDPIDSGALVRDISVHLHDLKDHLGAYLDSFGDRAPVHSLDEILASGKYTPDIEENLRTASRLTCDSDEYRQRLKRRAALQKQVLDLLAEYRLDALVYPHQQQLVCKIGASQQQRNGALASVTGFPAVAVPGGFTRPSSEAPAGVPVGIEFLAGPFREGTLIEIASGFERALPARRPPRL